jgi:VCBS repeat-containing protein
LLTVPGRRAPSRRRGFAVAAALGVDHAGGVLEHVPGPAHGTLALNANGAFTYTPAASYTGPDSFQYQASDGALLSNTATVTITVS